MLCVAGPWLEVSIWCSWYIQWLINSLRTPFNKTWNGKSRPIFAFAWAVAPKTAHASAYCQCVEVYLLIPFWTRAVPKSTMLALYFPRGWGSCFLLATKSLSFTCTLNLSRYYHPNDYQVISRKQHRIKQNNCETSDGCIYSRFIGSKFLRGS